MSSKSIKAQALNNVLTNAKKKKETGVSDIKKQATQNVINSIRNKDAVYRTWDKITPEETARKRLSTIYRVAERNPEAASRMYEEYSAKKQDKTSKFFDPYTQSTHSSIKKLQELGYDVDNINDDWFKKNSGLKQYLQLNDYTNSVKKPGKKASREEKAAYEYYQLEKAEDKTKKAEKESQELRKYLTDMATAKDRTMRDDEIVASINWKKYPTLANMREYAKNGAPMALNRAVEGSGNDWAYGVLWAAMNNGGTGNSDQDIANSYLQNGKTWARNQYLKQLKQKAVKSMVDQTSGQIGQGVSAKPILSGKNPKNFIDKANQYNADQLEAQKQAFAKYMQQTSFAGSQFVKQKPSASISKTRAANTWAPDDQAAENLAKEKAGYQAEKDENDKQIAALQAEIEGRDPVNTEAARAQALLAAYVTPEIENELAIINGKGYTEEEKQNAQRKLAELQQKGQFGVSNFMKYGYLNNADDPTRIGYIRQQLYDNLYGRGEYDRVTAEMSAKEKNALDKRLDDAITNAANEYGQTGIDLAAAQEQGKQLDKQIEQVTRQEQALATVNQLAGQATGSGEYKQQNIQERMTTEGDAYYYIPGGNDLDMSVYYANHPWEEMLKDLYGSNTDWSKIKPHWSDVRSEYFMNEEQVRVLNQLYGNGTPEEKARARAFMDALNTYCLNTLKVQYQEEYQREKADSPLGIFEGIATIPINLVAGLIGTGGSIAALFGNEAAKDPNSEWYNLQRYVTNTRDQRGDVWDEGMVNAFGDNWKGVGKFLSGVTYSMADNLMAMAASSGLGNVFGYEMSSKAAERMIQLVMSSEAASSTMLEKLKAGVDPTEAAILSIGGGLVEAITEKYSIEALLDPNVREMLGSGKQLLQFLGKNTLAEGTEEGASDVLNLVLDEIVAGFAGHDSEIRQQVKDLMASDPSMTQDQAERQVIQQWFEQLGMDIAAGALSGLVMSGGRIGLNAASQQGIGKQIRTGNNTSTRGIQELLNAGVSMPEGTQSYQIAKELQSKMDQGKKVSNYDAGRLVQNIFNDADENVGKAARTVVEDRAYDALEGKDVNMDRREAAQLIAKAVSGEELSGSERRAITKNKALMAAYTEFMTPTETGIEAQAETISKTRAENQARESVSELLGTKKAAEIKTDDIKVADADEIREADQNAQAGRGKRTGKANDVIIGGEYAQITGMKSVMTGKEGNRTEQHYFTVKTSDGKTALVNVKDSSSIRALDFGTAAIIREATVNPGLYQASANQQTTKEGSNFNNYTDILLKAQADGKIDNIGNFLPAAMKVRMAAFTGKAMPVTNIDQGVALEIYKNAAAEHKANREGIYQTKNKNAKAAGQGTARFQGMEYGTKSWVRPDNVDKNTWKEMEAAAEIARRKGIELTFYTAEEAKSIIGESDTYGYYGWENAKGIGINIEGIHNYVEDTKNEGLNEGKGRHHILVTFGHEMTHWLQRNSLNGYNKLERFVMDDLTRRYGEGYLNKRLSQIMESQEISLEDAMSELVADSCDQILADENVQKHIAETDKGLLQEIKGFVKDLVARIKSAVQNMGESMSYDAMAMMRSANELAKLWLGAYDDVLSEKIAENEGKVSEETKYSKAAKEYKFDPSFEKMIRLYKKDSAAFKNKYGSTEVVIGETFKILQDIGIANKPMVLDQEHLEKAFGKNAKANHKLTPSEMMEIIRKANDPVTIIKSRANGRENDSVVIIVDYLIDGDITMVPIRVSAEGFVNNLDVDVNRMASAHSRDNMYNILKDAVETELKGQKPGIYYINKNKAEFLRREGVQFPSSAKSNSGLIHTIADNPDFVNQAGTHKNNTENLMQQIRRNSRAQMDSDYMQAVESGDTKRQQELVDQVAEAAGYTIRAYHGSNAAFTTFQGGNRSEMWFASTPETAYKRNFMYDTYLKMKNPYEVTYFIGAESKFDPTFVTEEGRRNGHDGAVVHFKLDPKYVEMNLPFISEYGRTLPATDSFGDNFMFMPHGKDRENLARPGEKMVDFMERGAKEALYDWYVVYGPNQIKSADPVTYDDDGNVIPLSERFNSEKGDIRYSRAQLNEEYKKALESGDVEQQKEIISESAELAMPNSKVKENGKLLKMYHGTPATFTVFRRDMIGSTGRFEGSGFNFTPVRERAASYGNGGHVLEGYLDIQNPLSSEKKTISVNQLAQLIRKADPTGDYIISDYARETRDYGSESFVRREAMTAARQIWNASDNDVDIYSFISAADPDAESLIQVFSDLNYDGLIHYNDNGTIKTAVAFNPEQFKLADPVTYDDDGEPIELDKRMNMQEPDMRFSQAIQDEQEAEENGIDLDIDNHTATMFSRASFERSEYYKNPDEMAKMLARNVLGSESKKNIAKAKKWIKDVTGIAAIITQNPEMLDYVASPGRSSFKSNPEYGGSIDSSTICAKRRLQTGTIDAIQEALPDYVMTAEDFLQVRRMMKERGYEVSCGLCFVESSRKNIAKYANQFMREWNSQHPDNQVNMKQINTVLGLEDTRLNNSEVYKAYETFMNKLAQRKPKLFEMRSEYDNDIMKHFRNDDSVKDKNKNGGMRINSFSDFEIVHLIDMMQVIMDMSNVGLAGQAYTKVREFAEALGPTGLKINMSMIAKGVDENGRIIFDEVEGMKWSDVEDLRNRYADNVGTVCVIFSEDQLMAAMADDRIDFIIPFHRSQWNKSNYKDIGLPENTKDFTYWQNERYAKPVYGKKKDGTPKKLRATNYMPNEYWNPKLSGKENAEAYLKMCAENNKIPKFWKWLQPNGDGSFRLKDDGSTDGYWKLLGDFKMYNHLTGDYAAQMPVKPEFDMDACERMLKEYKGGHQSFPKAQDVVDDFVNEKKKGRKGIKTGKGGKIQLAGNEIDSGTRMSKATPESMDVGLWMAGQTPGSLQTEDERTLLQAYKDLRIKISLSIKRQLDYKEQIRKLESSGNKLTAAEREDLESLRFKLQAQQDKQAALEDELYRVTSSEGYAGMMYRNNIVLKDFILGKTQDQVRESVEQMVDQVKVAEKLIAEQAKKLEKLAASQEVKAAEKLVDRKALNCAVNSLKKETNTSMGKKELEARVTEMALRKAAGEDITEDARALAVDMTNKMRGYQLDVMERMRGVTITIGPDEQAEMKGNGMTLASVRQALKGTGVKVQYGDYSSLDTDTQEGGDLRILLPELPEDIGENSADALNRFISWAQSMRDGDLAAKQEMVDVEDTTMNVLALVSTIGVGENTAEYQKQNALAASTRKMANELKQTGEALTEKTEMAGRRAVGMASVLQRDVHQAIEYYNTIAKKAAQEEKTKVKKDLIAQLRSENTRKLIQQQEKYQEMMRKDRKARETAEDNRILRNRITDDMKRLKKRILEETDRENIPEAAKPLARKVMEMLLHHDFVGYRRVLNYQSKESMEKTVRAIDSLNARDGAFDPSKDLNWLIVGSGDVADTEMADRAYQDLMDIETGLMEYRTADGQGLVSVLDRKAALEKINHAVSEIWKMINARSVAEVNGRNMLVWEVAQQALDDMQNSRFKGEYTGKLGHGLAKIKSFIVSGNTTPEYFFKNLRNNTLSQLYNEYHRAENRNGLEVGKAQRRIAEIAEKYGYKNWDPKKRYTFKLEKGGEVSLTLGEMMSLYATWERERLNQIEVNGPEESYHLKVGGFYTQQEEKAKILGREIVRQKAHKLTEGDMAEIRKAMTEEQLDYVSDMVQYMTKDIGALGNEASMRMYGIKKYNEKWYFPFEIWDGVKSRKSDQGAAGNTENRIAHSSFSKRRVNNASNALVIRDFTETAVKHIAQMINYNTFAPAIEFMNRVMNQQLTDIETITEGDMESGKKIVTVVPEGETKRNLRAAFIEWYGKEAMNYLDDFQEDINGGVKRQENTVFDKLLSVFKKNAVAGSLSVAAQQPLSYIRAAMMINPKYLAAAINPAYYKGSRDEMEKYSGVAVIKRMGKFDINLGKTAQDFMMPEGKKTKPQAISETAGNIATGLPELMDMMTWTRMWTACKLEQKALNPGMDVKSDEFLEKVAERFNDVMRKTQVYDSMLVRSRNMRSTNYAMKGITSFMAEPTLTANVLADAVANVKEKGGKATLAKAGATFVLSAVLQALVKGLISAGRNPQDKKTFDENVLYRFTSNLINELNPFSLIPGYGDLMELLMNGELSDDAMNVIGKIMEAADNTGKLFSGDGDPYRTVEDSIGQLAQLFTNIPMKNIMRDGRAMWNYITQPYAQRENSKAVLYYQLMDLMHNSQNLTGVINKRLGSQGWETKNSAYYNRIYQADRKQEKTKVADLIEYMKKARGVSDNTLNQNIRKLYKEDENMSSEEKLKKQQEYGLKDGSEFIRDEYKAGNIDRKTAEKLYKEAHPKMTDKQIKSTFDKIDEEKKK